MPRPLFLVVVAIFCLGVTARADDPDPRKMPVVKKVLDKAESEVRKNRKAYDEANAKTFEDAETALKEEVDRLSKAGKLEEAVAVKKFAERMGKEVLANAENKIKPPHPEKVGAAAWKGHKYKFFAEPMTWYDAKKRCEEMGGYLVVIEDPTENTYVTQSLAAMRDNSLRVWIGISRGKAPGEWVTTKGQKSTFQKWSGGSPSNSNGNEDCVEMMFHDGALWNDRNGSALLPFVCEWDE